MSCLRDGVFWPRNLGLCGNARREVCYEYCWYRRRLIRAARLPRSLGAIVVITWCLRISISRVVGRSARQLYIVVVETAVVLLQDVDI